MPPHSPNGPASKIGGSLTLILNRLLADDYSNRVTTRAILQTAAGKDFADFRELLETQALGIDRRLNLLAWQIGLFGACARISAAVTVKTRRGFAETGPGSANRMLEALVSLRARLLKRIRSAIGLCPQRPGDAGTGNLLLDLTAHHERDMRLLRVLLSQKRRDSGRVRPACGERPAGGRSGDYLAESARLRPLEHCGDQSRPGGPESRINLRRARGLGYGRDEIAGLQPALG